MNNATVIPFVQKAITKHSALITVATAATGLMRQMAIKPFTPRKRDREFHLIDRIDSMHAVHNRIFKEKGSGTIPTIVIGGFVPDATEAMEFQRPLLKRYGSVYYLNYSRNGFSMEMFFAQLADLIADINMRGKRPVLFGISFGCGLIREFLRSTVNSPSLTIKGVVMVSPVLCAEDLVRAEQEKGSGVTMLESNLKSILMSDPTRVDDVSRQIEIARRCFQSLFEAGAENRRLDHRLLSVRKKIMDAVARPPAVGGYQRVLALREFLPPQADTPIFAGQSLVLLAEGEEEVLVPSSPTLAALKNPDIRPQVFPRGKVRTVISSLADDTVAHASLIFHYHCYNPLIEAWYDKLLASMLFAAI